MKKILFLLTLLTILLTFGLRISVNADTGPKPFVHITFNNVPNDEYYVALLSDRHSTGPFGRRETDQGMSDVEKKFYNYVDSDGYLYIGNYQKLTKDNNVYKWGYYPPRNFKILIYIESEDKMIFSNEVYSRYAFESYFDVKYEDGNLIRISTPHKYKAKEALNCILRIVITLVIEIGLALLFKYRNKALVVIVIANLVTQVLLNVFVAIDHYHHGTLSSMLMLIALEIVIFIIELIVYIIVLPKVDKESTKLKAFLYSLCANIASFGIGLVVFTFLS